MGHRMGVLMVFVDWKTERTEAWFCGDCSWIDLGFAGVLLRWLQYIDICNLHEIWVLVKNCHVWGPIGMDVLSHMMSYEMILQAMGATGGYILCRLQSLPKMTTWQCRPRLRMRPRLFRCALDLGWCESYKTQWRSRVTIAQQGIWELPSWRKNSVKSPDRWRRPQKEGKEIKGQRTRKI